MKSMTPREYEDYVEEVIRQFDFWNAATVTRNRRFPGVRQPGNYEVDIAFEVALTELVSFLLIVECKNHGRPVTRPVIQQLAQTRDAISAQKAAVVSPRGFTSEAVAVAAAQGIALWVIAVDVPTEVVMAYEGLKILSLSDVFYELRAGYLEAFGIDVKADQSPLHLINVGRAIPGDSPVIDNATFVSGRSDSTQPAGDFFRGVRGGSAFFSYESHPMFDPDCALFQVVDGVFATSRETLLQDEKVGRRLDKWREASAARFPDPTIAEKALACASSNDWPGFYRLF
jgi:Restriction endonuclease